MTLFPFFLGVGGGCGGLIKGGRWAFKEIKIPDGGGVGGGLIRVEILNDRLILIEVFVVEVLSRILLRE